MKGRIIVPLMVVIMAMLVLSIKPYNKPLADSQKSKHQAATVAQVDEDDDFGIVDIQNQNRHRHHISPQGVSPQGNLVYVGDNISTGAGVRILQRNADGTLTDMPNSPMPTGGKGAFDVVGFNRKPTGIFAAVDLGPYELDKNLFLTDDASKLFICNQGSNDLSVFNVSADGTTLTPAQGSPYKTGISPGSVTLAAFDTVVVLNKNDPPGNPKPPGVHASIQTFKMASDGSLTPVPNSEIDLPSAVCGEGIVCGQTSSPSEVLTAAEGKIVFLIDFMGGFIRPYVVQPDSTLKATKPFDIRSLGEAVLPTNLHSFPFALNGRVHPNKNILYVGLPFENEVGVFSFNPKNGKLKFIKAVPNSGLTVCWFYIKDAGDFMYTSDQVSNSVSTYDLSDPTTPKEIQLTQFQECGEPAEVDASEFSPDQSYIYFCIAPATNRCAQNDPTIEVNFVHTLKIDPSTGMLSDVSVTPLHLPVGERDQGIFAN